MTFTKPILAVLGGSFDPPHIAHVLLPTYVLSRGLAEKVLVAPCWQHPFAKQSTDFTRRLTWTRLAMAIHGPQVMVSDLEAQLAIRRGLQRPSYTIELLDEVAKRYPEYSVRLLIGSDIVARGELQKWHQYLRMNQEYAPIVIPRAGYSEPYACVLPEISSTQIRTWLANKDKRLSAEENYQRLAHVLPKSVLNHIVSTRNQPIWLIGHGHVASHARLWLLDRGWQPVLLSARKLLDGCEKVPEERPEGVWILCQDAYLPQVANSFVQQLKDPQIPILHGAGAIVANSIQALAAARGLGHPVGTLHPICSLRAECSHSLLHQAWFGIEGDEAARTFAKRLIDSQPWLDLQSLTRPQRLAYHAGCALAANQLAVLFASAVEIFQKQSFATQQSEGALAVLMQSALANLLALGLPKGVTGPVARNDWTTVKAHLDALTTPDRELYEHLSKRLQLLLETHKGMQPEVGNK